MAMTQFLHIADAHKSIITCVEYLPFKREYASACEGGFLSFWEADTGQPVQTVAAHLGAITSLAVWAVAKLLFSGCLDGTVKVWTTLLECRQVMDLGTSVFCLAWHVRTSQLLIGLDKLLNVHSGRPGSSLGSHELRPKADYKLAEHDDIIMGICSYEGRVYTAGFDCRLVVYETYSERGRELIHAIGRRKQAHECGICFLNVGQDNTGNVWIVTGSYDRIVRVWSTDLHAIYTFGPHIDDIRGVGISHQCNQLWVVVNAAHAAIIYDPKSGEDISSSLFTYEQMSAKDLGILKLFSWKETGDIVGTTRKKSLLIWRYDQGAPIVINKLPVTQEALTYTRKVPILIFSGGVDGDIVKLEKQQLSNLSFSTETLSYTEAASKVKLTEEELFAREEARRQESNGTYIPEKESEKSVGINRVVFVESCDFLIATSDDANVYIWGFDETHRKAQHAMEEAERLNPETSRVMKFMSMSTASFGEGRTPRPPIPDEDSSGKRVAGFDCLSTLCYHISSVTAAVVIPQQGNKFPFLLTSGWDRRIVLWNLYRCTVVDVLRPPAAVKGKAAGDIVTDLAYSPELNLYAYSSADKKAYIRKFSRDGTRMLLMAELTGHGAEVTAICWNKFTSTWVTTSVDQSLSIWSSRGETRLKTFRLDSCVSCLTIDKCNGCILAGTDKIFWIFNPYTYHRLRKSKGHNDRIKSILHIPELSQYVTCSWDKTMRLWHAHKAPVKPPEEDKEEDDADSEDKTNGRKED